MLKSDKKVFPTAAGKLDLTEVYKVMSVSSLLHDFIKHLWGQKLYAYFAKITTKTFFRQVTTRQYGKFLSHNIFLVKPLHCKVKTRQIDEFYKRVLHVGNNLDPILEEVDNLRGLDPVEAHDVHPDDLAGHTHAPDAVAQGAEVLDVDLAKENSK